MERPEDFAAAETQGEPEGDAGGGSPPGRGQMLPVDVGEASGPALTEAGPGGGVTQEDSRSDAGQQATTEARDAGQQAAGPSPPLSPRVIAVSPPPGSVGVRAGTPLSIEFSGPMEPSSTRAALVAPWLSREARQDWNEAGTVLTVFPELSYADQPTSYEYTLSTQAVSQEGLALAEAYVARFTLAKTLDVVVAVASAENRNWAPGLTGAFSFLLAGDDASGSVYRAFFAYPLRVPSGEVLGVERAMLRTNLRSVDEGVPFEVLGDLVIQHSRYTFTSVPTIAMYGAETYQSMVLIGRDAPAPAVGAELTLDVTTAFQRTWVSGWDKCQFIMGFFDPSTNLDAAGDTCHIGNSGDPGSENYNRVELTWLCADDCTP